jgi:non-ribosomal peptide synthase protein (TIGR01720 family)
LLNEQLHVNWTYSEQIHERTTIEQLARRFISALQSLILHCQSVGVNGHVLAGLSDEALTNADLEAILTQINR